MKEFNLPRVGADAKPFLVNVSAMTEGRTGSPGGRDDGPKVQVMCQRAPVQGRGGVQTAGQHQGCQLLPGRTMPHASKDLQQVALPGLAGCPWAELY